MKKILIFSLLLATNQFVGQDKKINFGLKTGLNYSKYFPNQVINGQEISDYNRKLSYYGGFFVSFKIENKFYFQPELLFSEQGTELLIPSIEITDQNGGIIGVGDFKANIVDYTIAIPLNFKYKVFNNFFVESGFQFEYIFQTKSIVKEDPLFLVTGNKVPNSDIENGNYDIGSILGLSYSLNNKLSLTFRNYIGFIKRENNSKSTITYLGVEYKL